MKLHSLLLFSFVSIAFSVKRDWNAVTDKNFDRQNQMTQWKKATTKVLGEGRINEVYYRKANLLGLDSLWRTGDCFMTQIDNCRTIDLHYGLRLAVIDLPVLKVDGKTMSGYIRSVNNSVHYRINTCKNPCHVKIELFQLEDMGTIVFGASRPEYDGMDISGLVRRIVVPRLQRFLDRFRMQLENDINTKVCIEKTESSLLNFI